MKNIRKRIVAYLSVGMMITNICAITAMAENTDVKIYVSPQGVEVNDINKANVGTIDEPISINGIAKKLKYERERHTNTQIQVILRGGEYRLESSLVLTDTESGYDNENRVVIDSFSGEAPVLKGSTLLDYSDFLPVTDVNIKERLRQSVRDEVLCLDLNQYGLSNLFTTSDPEKTDKASKLAGEGENSYSYVNLYYNSKEQPVSQWPDGDGQYSDFDAVADNNLQFVEKNIDAVSRWQNAKDAFAIGYFGADYRINRVAVDSVSADGIVTLSEKPDLGTGNTVTNRWKIAHLLEEIDVPGEWYIDHSTMMLYYYPPYDFGENSILELSTLKEPMIKFQKAENITIRNLTFSQTRGHAIVDYLDRGNMDGSRTWDNFTIEGCDFENIGGYGINFHTYMFNNINSTGQRMGYVKNLLVQNNTFYNMWLGAWNIHSGNSKTIESYNTVIKNNYVNQPSYMTNATMFGTVAGVGVEISNNLAHNGAFQALYFSGSENRISNNSVYNSLRETLDAGVFYIGRNIFQRNNVLSNNFIYKARPVDEEVNKFCHNKGIYFDDGYAASKVEKNIVVDSGTAMSTSGSGSEYYNNISVDCINGIEASIGRGINQAAKTNYEFFYGTDFDEALRATYTNKFSGIKTEYDKLNEINFETTVLNNVSGNYFVNGILPDTKAMDIVKANNTYSNNIKSDSYDSFINPDGLDFRVKTSSEIFAQNSDLPSENDTVGMVWEQTALSKAEINSKRGFKKLYPENGTNISKNDTVHFMWEKAYSADEYKLVIATDTEFNNIVFEKTVPYNYCDVEGIDFNSGKYYWNVYAENITKELNGEWLAEEEAFSVITDGQSEVFDITECTLLGNRIKITFNDSVNQGTVNSNISVYDENNIEADIRTSAENNTVWVELPNELLNRNCTLKIFMPIRNNNGEMLRRGYIGAFTGTGFFEDFGEEYQDGDWVQNEMNGRNNAEVLPAQIVDGELYLYRRYDNTNIPFYVYNKDYESYKYNNSVLEFDYTGMSAFADGDYQNKFGIITKLNNSGDNQKGLIYASGWYNYINSGYLMELVGTNRDLKIISRTNDYQWMPYGNENKKAGNLCVKDNKYRIRIETMTKADGVYCDIYKADYNGGILSDYKLIVSEKMEDTISNEGSFAFAGNNGSYSENGITTYYHSENKVDNCLYSKIEDIVLTEDNTLNVISATKDKETINISFSSPLSADVGELNDLVHIADSDGLVNADISLNEDKTSVIITDLTENCFRDITVSLKETVTSVDKKALGKNLYYSFSAEGDIEKFDEDYNDNWKMRAWGKNPVIYPENNGMILPMAGTASGDIANGGMIYNDNYKNYLGYKNQTLYFDYMRSGDTTNQTALQQNNLRAFIRATEFTYTQSPSEFTVPGAYFLGIEKEGTELIIGKINGKWSAEKYNGLEIMPESVTELNRVAIDKLTKEAVYSFKLNAADTADGKVKITAYIKNTAGMYQEVISATDETDVIESGSYYFLKGANNWGTENNHYLDNICFYNDDSISVGANTLYEDEFNEGLDAVDNMSISERIVKAEELKKMAVLIMATNENFDSSLLEKLEAVSEFKLASVSIGAETIELELTQNIVTGTDIRKYVSITDSELNDISGTYNISGNKVVVDIDKLPVNQKLVLAIKKGLPAENGKYIAENQLYDININGYYDNFEAESHNWKIKYYYNKNGSTIPKYNGGIKSVTNEELGYAEHATVIYKDNYEDYQMTDQVLSFDYVNELTTTGDEGSKYANSIMAFIRADKGEYDTANGSNLILNNGAYYFRMGYEGSEVSIGKIKGTLNIDNLNNDTQSQFTVLSKKSLSTSLTIGEKYSFKVEAKDVSEGVMIRVLLKNADGKYEELLSAVDSSDTIKSGTAYFATVRSNWGSRNAHILDNINHYGMNIQLADKVYNKNDNLKMDLVTESGNSIALSNGEKANALLKYLNFSEDTNNTLWIAFYNGDTLICAKPVEVNVDNVYTNVNSELTIPENTDNAKIMLWSSDGTQRPITEAIIK